MSTYSWSYKTASHRQVPGKQAETQQEDCQKDKVLPKVPSSPNIETGTGVSKRCKRMKKIAVQLFMHFASWVVCL